MNNHWKEDKLENKFFLLPFHLTIGDLNLSNFKINKVISLRYSRPTTQVWKSKRNFSGRASRESGRKTGSGEGVEKENVA